jgi:hypothetical protein
MKDHVQTALESLIAETIRNRKRAKANNAQIEALGFAIRERALKDALSILDNKYHRLEKI